MAASLRPALPHSLSVDSQDNVRPSPKVILTPASSTQESLKSESPSKSPPNTPSRQSRLSRRVLFSYQHVFFIFKKSTTSLPSRVCQRSTPELEARSATMAGAQHKSIMFLKLEGMKDKWHGFKRRTSPAGCRCAGCTFLVILLLILGSVIVGWYGLSKATLAHQTVTTYRPQTTPTLVDYHDPSWVTPTITQGPWDLAQKDVTVDPPVLAAHLFAAESKPKTSLDDVESITLVRTIIVTVTTVITDTSLETLTTTVLLSTCTTCTALLTTDASTHTTNSQRSTSDGVMTGIMYCSFTGRRNIYTLCPRVHTASPAMLTDTPAAVSSATPRIYNPFSVARIALVSLWSSVPSLARAVQTRDQDRCACNCAGMKKKLEAAVHLVRMQQQLLNSQRTMINNHRKGLSMVLETLTNMTATRVGEKASQATPPLDLNI